MEISLEHSATLVISTFLDNFAAAVSASRSQWAATTGISGGRQDRRPEIRMLSEAGGMSVEGLITDSYIRNNVRVPSSLSQMLPKLQFVCPRVRGPRGNTNNNNSTSRALIDATWMTISF